MFTREYKKCENQQFLHPSSDASSSCLTRYEDCLFNTYFTDFFKIFFGKPISLPRVNQLYLEYLLSRTRR